MSNHRDQADPRIADMQASETPPKPKVGKFIDLGLTYEQALHGMQTGVTYEMSNWDGSTSPKHLRVGVNSAMISDYAIAQLLIDKGITTWEEHGEYLRLAANNEVAIYEQRYPGIKFR